MGAEIECNAEVKEIWIENGETKGVVMADGSKIEGTKVVSNLDC